MLEPATTDPHGLIRAGVCTNPKVLELIEAKFWS